MAKNPWFDDLSDHQKLKVAEGIRAAEQHIDKGWAIGSRQRGDRVCLVGAIGLAVYGDAHASMRNDPVIKGITHSIANELACKFPLVPTMSADMAATFLIQVNDSSSNPRKIRAAMDRAAEHFEHDLGVQPPKPYQKKTLIRKSVLDRIPLFKRKPEPPEANAFADARQEDMDLAAGPGH